MYGIKQGLNEVFFSFDTEHKKRTVSQNIITTRKNPKSTFLFCFRFFFFFAITFFFFLPFLHQPNHYLFTINLQLDRYNVIQIICPCFKSMCCPSFFIWVSFYQRRSRTSEIIEVQYFFPSMSRGREGKTVLNQV